ncbi:hypothetical protein PZT66_24865 [Pseudomonas aeruginosa]|uniref:hypothetical protein n=1 Tax=Pseudomonas aeruginosa TaxID=287 RepID=UPI0005B4C5CA|nr:hypothetical protein [Pseudomonas aeruginosa]MBA5212884.1 hypothetical protein [Pseudomonas aeruginosa]MBG3916976.1 hypothetical protein [Pseudomonas aeruginosa]MBG4468107.1 hypothetical protein [Pseudomonas aeruginosa]MBG5240432.1 hypothetical protein [Pseudomonas aeruginosa]MBG6810295.1 hypothetical protein [Pseudomonas aeruginosa]
MVTVYTYHVKAFAPDPRNEGNYFTYDSTVDRDSPLNNGQEYDALAKGLSDHVYTETCVRVGQGSFVIQNVELLGTREEKKFPASGLAK